MQTEATHDRGSALTPRRALLVVAIPFLILMVLVATMRPATAQDAPNGSVPTDEGTLTVYSDVEPNDGSVVFGVTATGITGFQRQLQGDAHTGPITVTVGTYTVALTSSAADKYDTAYACAVDGTPGPNGSGRTASVNVTKDAAVACLFTHTRKTGRITMVKAVDGGSAGASAWRFAVNGTPLSGIESGDEIVLPTGDYVVTETGPTTYRLVAATGACRVVNGQVQLRVTTDGGTCTLTSRAAGLHIIEPYGVSRVEEGVLTGNGSSSCYRIISTVPPTGNVRIQFSADEQVNTQPTSHITLNQSNWNLTEGTDVSNLVCVRAADDAIDAVSNVQCKNRTRTVAGGGDSGTAVCGEAVSFVEHTVAASDDLAFSAATPFTGNTLRDLDSDAATVDVLLVDNDTARVIINQVQGVTAVVEGGGTATYAVVLGSQPLDTVIVKLEFDAAQLQVTPNQLTFGPLDWQPPKTVTVRAVDDPEDDPERESCQPSAAGAQVCGDHEAAITHSIESDDANYQTAEFEGNGPDGSEEIIVLIRDNDIAGLQAAPATVSLVEGQGGVITVRLRTRPSDDVDVTIEDPAIVAGSFRPDQRSAVTLRFTRDDWDVGREIAVTEADNDLADGTRRRLPRITFSSLDPHYSGETEGAIRLEITDDDSPGIIRSTSALTVFEGGDPVAYSLQLTTQPTATVAVSITTSGRAMVEPSVVTFTPESWNVPQAVYVTAQDDATEYDQAQQEWAAHLASSLDPTYAGITTGPVSIDIVDNDSAGLSVTPAARLSVREGGEVAYALALQTRPVAPISVTVTTDAALTAAPATVTFSPEDWNIAQTITLTAHDNFRDSPEDRLAASVQFLVETEDSRYAGIELGELVVDVVDNDHAAVLYSAAAIAVGAGDTGAYSLVLGSEPTASVLVVLVPSLGLTIHDGCPADETIAHCLLFTPENWATPQTVTVTPTTAARHTVRHTTVSSDPAYGEQFATIVVDKRASEGSFRFYLPAVTRPR